MASASNNTLRALALLAGTHSRLGSRSHVYRVPLTMLRDILSLATDRRVLVGTSAGDMMTLDLATAARGVEFRHDRSAMRCMQIIDDVVMSGHKNGDVAMWNPNTGKLLRIVAHNNSRVNCMHAAGGSLACGHANGEVLVLDALTCDFRRTLRFTNANQQVMSLWISEDIVMCGLDNGTIEERDLVDGGIRRIFANHRSCVRCLQIANGILMSCSWDGTINLRKLAAGDLVRKLNCKHPDMASCMHMVGNTLVVGFEDGMIMVWSIATEEGRFFKNKKSSIRCLQIRGDVVVAGMRYDYWPLAQCPACPGYVKTFDLATGACAMTVNMNSTPNCLCCV